MRSSGWRRRRTSSLSIALALGGAAAPARADDRAAIADVLVVRHGVASGCPGGAALAARIDAVAGRAATSTAGGADTRITVTFSPSANGGLGAVLEASGARSGLRDFEDPDVDCVALAEAVAVATALLLDAGWTAPPPPASPPRSPAASPPPSRPSVLPPPSPPPPTKQAEPAAPDLFALGAAPWAVDAWTAFDTALGDGGFVAVGAMARRRFGPASAGAGVEITFPYDVVDDFGRGSVSAWSLGASLEGCLDVRVERASSTISPCATGSVRTVVASGSGFAEEDTSAQPMVGLGGALELSTRVVRPFSLLLRGGAEAEVVRPTFRVRKLGSPDARTGEAFEPNGLGVDVGAGARVEFE